ncbi:BatD family protein [Pedobacter sp. B4-66]|uniref:BatD family protein n=1 Tax=Pedobacter sp. B4-66 TaxID=2817280 RepID=UPI001BDAE1EA|nr:BatD family protein [Pedobacter sp. B4-66]
MKQYFNFSWCLMLCLACFTYKSNAQDIKVEAKLDKSTIVLGDQTILRLSAQLPINDKISFPILADTISSKVQIVEVGKTDTIADKSNPAVRTISRQYTITSFEAGLQTIPAFLFQVNAQSFKTDPVPLQVTSVAVDTTKAIYDIKQPLAVRYSFLDWLRDHWQWVVVSLLGVILIVGLLYYFWQKRKNRPIPAVVKPLVPADVTAINKLVVLRDKKLWQQEEVKQYHIELTDILREYLEKRYHIKALEQTSDEIFAGLRHMEITDQNRNKLRQILMLADLVKFAKGKPLNSENEQSIENAISFVSDTKEINQLPDNKAQNETV